MIRAGLIGLGKMGISHHAIMGTHPDLELVAVCDSSQYVLDVLDKYTPTKTCNDYRRLIDEYQLDCVVIATPSKFHGEMVRYALGRGLHVFCEKPFCLDLREGQRLADLAAARDCVNQVGYHYRHVATFLEARRLLRAGVLGEIHHVRAEAYGPVVLRAAGSTWRSRKEEGGGCLYDYASHAIDLVNFLVGVPTRISGAMLNRIFSKAVEDEVYASMHFANGATGQIAANWTDESQRKMSTRISIWGSNGRMTIDRQECEIYLRSAVEDDPPLSPGWTVRHGTDLLQSVWFYLRGEEYSGQIDHFVQCIKSREKENICSFKSALETDKVLQAVLAAAREDEAGSERSAVPRKRPAGYRRLFGFASRAGS
jgi:scyllo-inositol 2-dehydrogenase (NADP+)